MSQLQLGLPWSLLRDASEALLLRWIRSLGLLFTERQPSPWLGVPFFLMGKSCCTLRAQPPATPRRCHRCRGSVLGIYQAGARLSLSKRRERLWPSATGHGNTWGPIPLPQCCAVSPQGDSRLLPWLLTRALLGPEMETSNPESQSSGSRLCPKLRLMPRPSSAHFTREHALPRRPSRAAMLPR